MGFLPDQTAADIGRAVEARGMILVELVQRGREQTKVLEVIVDAADRGVGLDELTELTREVNALLDQAGDAIAGRYRLEVSTPGLDRPLQHAWQFRKNIGRLLKLTLAGSGADPGAASTILCRLTGITGNTLHVAELKPRTGGRKPGKQPAAQPWDLPLEKVLKAVVEPEL